MERYSRDSCTFDSPLKRRTCITGFQWVPTSERGEYTFIESNRPIFAVSAKKAAGNIVLFSIMNESGQMTQKLDNRADMKGCSQTQKNRCLHEGMACRRQVLGVPVQFSCHLSTPTHHLH